MAGLGIHIDPGEAAFLAAAVLGIAVVGGGLVLDMRGNAQTKMRKRLETVIAEANPIEEATDEEARSILARRRKSGILSRTLLGRRMAAIHQRLSIIGGPAGFLLLYVAPVLLGLGAFLAQRLAKPWPGLYQAPVAVLVAVGAAVFIYRFLERRFQMSFLDQFPDVLELIVRAVRAGVPVAQAIHVAGQELNEPIRGEFKMMADSLRLGADMGDVLEDAGSRIRVPDFNFFAVCILLQRETGGQLAETLENLARIIRARREIRLKARSLVAEGRAASKAIGAIPFLSLGLLYVFSQDYVGVLFTTGLGNKLLFAAAAMLVVGFIIINRMSRLED